MQAGLGVLECEQENMYKHLVDSKSSKIIVHDSIINLFALARGEKGQGKLGKQGLFTTLAVHHTHVNDVIWF